MFLDTRVGTLVEPLTGRTWDRAETDARRLRRMAALHSAGVSRGDRVFLHHGNTLEFFADLLAVWSLGACAVPIDGRLTPFEIGQFAEAARPRASILGRATDAAVSSRLESLGVTVIHAEEADASPAPPPAAATSLHLDDDALVLFTSGTTGNPKGVVHTHRSLRARWAGLRSALGTETFARTLCLLPTHFGHGLICNCLYPWLSGNTLYILPPYRADLLTGLGALIDEHRITFMSSVPPVWRLALKLSAPPRLQTLQRVFCGSAPLSGALWESVRKWTGTPSVFNAYGITETGSWLAGTTTDFEPEDGLIGVPWGGVLRVLKSADTSVAPWEAEACAPGEPGHIWVNTPALMKGYLGRDDLTSKVVAGGWFVTGDIGVLDEKGRLYLRGREREEINKGGAKLFPSDVDAVVERFDGVGDVCTFAYPDPLYGENVGMALVLKTPDDETLRGLNAWMGEHLAQHQFPERWYLVDEIPRTSRGKINRDVVSETCQKLRPLDKKRLLGPDRSTTG